MLTSSSVAIDESPRRFGTLQTTSLMEHRDQTELVAKLGQDGYLYLPAALDTGSVEEFRRFYLEQLDSAGLLASGSPLDAGLATRSAHPDAADVKRAHQYVTRSRQFARFCLQPAFRNLAEVILNGSTYLFMQRARHTRPPQTTSTECHYDLLYTHHDGALSFWSPLGHCPPRMGGLMYLEHSHQLVESMTARELDAFNGFLRRMTAPELAETLDTRWLTADYQPGDVVIHSPHMVHAALDNRDPEGRIRLSVDLRYRLAGHS